MTKLTTNFNLAPYFDDFNEANKFYRVLFRPAVAVQARELTTLQTTLQSQITKFAENIFKDGTIVEGCTIAYLPNFKFVRLEDTFNITPTRNFTDVFSDGVVLVGDGDANNGVRAIVSLAKQGFKTAFPNTNRLYVNYVKTGKDNSNNDVSEFTSGQVIHVYSNTQPVLGTLSNTNFIDTINVFTSNSSANGTGTAYGVRVDGGVVYQKGFMINVEPHTITVKDFDTNVNNYVIGFETTETIVTENDTPSLNDNALGYPNFRAPGAHRLKLESFLISKERDETDLENFFAIAEFDGNTPSEQRTNTEYNKLRDEFAKRTHEESGHYVVKQFQIETINSANSDTFYYQISPGIAYINGYRVELTGTKKIETNRANQFESINNLGLTTEYGNYIVVNDLSGSFSFRTNVEVDLYDTAQRSITNASGITGSNLGSSIGKANILSIQQVSGTKGSSRAVYHLHLTNIRMNSGQSFTSVRSVVQSSPTVARADLVLEGGIAVLKDSALTSLVYDTGLTATRNISDISYSFLQTSSATLNTNGFVTFNIPAAGSGGSERLVGPVTTDVSKLNYNFTLSTNTFTSNLAGTISTTNGSNTITGTGTSFTTTFASGEIFRYYASNGTSYQSSIENIANNTSLTLHQAPTFSESTGTYAKGFVAGQQLTTSGSNCIINIVSNTQFTASFSLGANLNATQTITASYPVQRVVSSPISKSVLKNTLVKIDCSNNVNTTTGPFNLGIPDVYSFRAFVGGTYSNTNPDRTNWFVLDSGQKDFVYDHARLIVRPEFASNLSSSSRILVEVEHFLANTSLGVGFFNVNSYPIDDATNANTSITIKTAEVPSFSSRNRIYNLKNSIDFRMYRPTTSVITANAEASTINPASNSSLSSTANYVSIPNNQFVFDAESYLPRYDVITLNKNGDLAVTKGTASRNPTIPVLDDDAAKIAEAYVPPYPSLTTREGEFFRTSDTIRISIKTNRRFTMRDIGVLEERIKRLEYYTVLSALERKAKDETILDESGLDRFKNGIFADPFNNNLIGNVGDIEYKVAIDSQKSVARPTFKTYPVDFALNTSNSSNIVVSRGAVTLPYVSENYITQRFATKFRNLTGALWQWNGKIDLYPQNDFFRDEQRQPAVNLDIDLSSAFEVLGSSIFGSNFGDWRTTNVSREQTGWAPTGTFADTVSQLGFWAPEVRITDTISEEQQRIVNQIQVDSVNRTQTLGDFVTDVSLQPYMRSRQVAFICNNMKPNTRLYAFFDDINVSQFCAPGVLSGVTNPSEGREDSVVNRTGNFGDPLVSNNNGFVCGIFIIPENTFRTGDRKFQLTNVDNLEVGADAKITVSTATYSASSLSVTKRTSTLTTREPIVRIDERVETRTLVTQESRIEWFDPVAQTFFTNMPGTVSGVYVTEIDLFFRTVDQNLGCTVYLMETNASVPDSTVIVGKAYRNADYLRPRTSADGSVASTFVFDMPVFLTAGKEYCFMVEPDGNSPEFNIWIGEAGGVDLVTNEQVFANPAAGVLFISSNRLTWTPFQKEDIKFILRRARFTSLSGTVVFENEDDDYITFDTLLAGNTALGSIVPGDFVYRTATGNTANTANTSPYGRVQSIDISSGTLIIDTDRKGFAVGQNIGFYRPPSTVSPTLTSATLVAVANISSVDDSTYNAIVPRFSLISPMRTSIAYRYKGTNVSNVIDGSFTELKTDVETEFFDYERKLISASNESSKSCRMEVVLNSENDFVSPMIDLSRKSNLLIKNIINNSSTNEHTRYGEAKAKYVSRNIILAQDQDAEDLMVYVSAYRPPNSNILVYAKFLNSTDGDKLEDKVWTLMNYRNSGDSVFSRTGDTTNIIEYTFMMPQLTPPVTNAAYLNADGILEYISPGNIVYRSYKEFAIKIVMLSSDGSRIPILSDVRAIALQA